MTPAAPARVQGVDTVVTRVVLAAVYGRLAAALAAAPQAGAPRRPWLLELPPDTGAVDWSEVRASLTRALHLRAPEAADTLRSVLSIRDARVTRDGVTVEFFTGVEWRCGASWTGGGTDYRARVEWARYIAVPESQPVAYYDSHRCDGAGRPTR